MRRAAIAFLLAAAGTGLAFGWMIPSAAATSARQEGCTGCHVAIQADTSSFQELTFPHLPHLTLEGGCLRCHGEHVATGRRAGINVTKGDCQACHHESARHGSAVCESCHSGIFGNSITFQDRPFNHSVHVGAFTGLECDDCHGEATEKVMASPPMSVCLGCHP